MCVSSLTSFKVAFVLIQSLVMFLIPSFPPSCFYLSFSTPRSYLQYVGGKQCKSESGSSVCVLAPGGGTVLAHCPDGGRKDVRNAVEAAIKVQPG